MNNIFKRFMAGAAISASLIFSSVANAMTISQFNKMSSSDQAEYLVSLLKGSVDALRARGNTQAADKILNLFSSGNGTDQLAKNLEALNALDIKNAANPNNKQPPYEVEQAFALTLKENGVVVPLNFLLSLHKNPKPQTK